VVVNGDNSRGEERRSHALEPNDAPIGSTAVELSLAGRGRCGCPQAGRPSCFACTMMSAPAGEVHRWHGTLALSQLAVSAHPVGAEPSANCLTHY
jgi:hypothetical protein